jgi:CDP-L-myo-inositol myo-inositolphosphotransferase
MAREYFLPREAIVRFGEVGAAARRIAGVAAAARILRELAEAGVARSWLLLPEGDTLDQGAMDDVNRLAGKMGVRVADGLLPSDAPLESETLALDGNRLFAASALRDGDFGPDSAAIRLDDPGASARILRQAGKTSDGPVSRHLNRPVSRAITAVLLHLPWIRPIHATVGTGLLALAMVVALLSGGTAGLIAGGLLFHAASIFDGVDGEIARATFRSTKAGAMLDSMVDIATNLAFVLGVTVNLAAAGDRLAPMLTAWGFALFLLGLAAVAWRASRSGSAFGFDVVKNHYRRRFPGRLAGGVIRFLIVVSSRDFFALLFPLLILAGIPIAVLCLFAAAATVWILFVLGAIRMPIETALAPNQA